MVSGTVDYVRCVFIACVKQGVVKNLARFCVDIADCRMDLTLGFNGNPSKI